MRNLDERTITQAVLERHADADPRLKEIMTSLVRHLHDFAREVRLTEAEWGTAIGFLTDVGHLCDDKRQEFILLSDTLGLSTLVTAQNHRKPPGCTEATVFGPFHVKDAPKYELGADISNGLKGTPCEVSGRVRGIDGKPVPGAVLDVWQADGEGRYDVQDPNLEELRGRGVLKADSEGRFHFRTILPCSYQIPHDGPVGRMLEALGRHPWRPAHLHFMVSAPGYETLITHVFREGDPYLDSDAVFGVRSSLIGDWVRHERGGAPGYTLAFDLVLNPAAR
jgi:hydroxyquinol 1,2-dioxygenase